MDTLNVTTMIRGVAGEPHDQCPMCQQLQKDSGLVAGTALEELRRRGIKVPPPEEITAEEMRYTLWGVIDSLADLGVFLWHTDHLDDQQLYTMLWRDLLDKRILLAKDGFTDYATLFDPTTSCYESDTIDFLRFYATKKERKKFAKRFGVKTLPEHVDPPFHRDAFLPSPMTSRKVMPC
jgi:hypothetical protein